MVGLEHTASDSSDSSVSTACACVSVFMSGICVPSAERQDCPCSVFCVQYLDLVHVELNLSCVSSVCCVRIPRCLTVSLVSLCIRTVFPVPTDLLDMRIHKVRTTTGSLPT
jgi:hypothetical protein